MKVWKNVRLILINILLVGSLLVAAFYVPDWFVKMKDQYSMEQINTRKLEMDAYELTYHNFAEKLYTIACVQTQGIAPQLIQMPDNETEVGNEELTECVIRELDLFLGEIWEIEIPLKEENLVERELYMLYGSYVGERSNALAGIYLYKLTFVTEWMGFDNVEFVIYMDAEFHKLYRFSISTFWANMVPPTDEDFLERLKGTWEEELDVVLPVNELVDYWGLEKSYRVDCIYGEEFDWKEKKDVWGKGSQDMLFLSENDAVISITPQLDVWSYLTHSTYNVFHVQMGIWLEENYTDAEVYDYTY